MKKSFITWRLSFASLPGKEEIRNAAALLAPIARVEKPDDYGRIARDFGLHDILFIGQSSERTAGEIALDALSRAHRIGRGWSITWPFSASSSEQGMTAREIKDSAMPESMEGFRGALDVSFPFVKMDLKGLESASYFLTMEEEEKVRDAPPRSEPVGRMDEPPPPPGPSAIEIITALGRLLISYGSTAWAWEKAGAARQAESLGFKPVGEEYEELYFASPDGTRLRIATDGEAVTWVEFILADFKDPHLLDETAFAQKQEEFEALFEQAVHYAKALLGPPLFKGASGEKGFPADQWAEIAAVWHKGEGRLMIQQKHNDRELPMELCLAFAP